MSINRVLKRIMTAEDTVDSIAATTAVARAIIEVAEQLRETKESFQLLPSGRCINLNNVAWAEKHKGSVVVYFAAGAVSEHGPALVSRAFIGDDAEVLREVFGFK
jgi:hypothetical protein